MSFASVENTQGGLMAEGDYEVVLTRCEQGQTKTTYTPVINFDFVVRSDVEQKYQKKHIFKSFYKEDATGEWPKEKIGKYIHSLGIEPGKEVELGELVGLCCIARIKHVDRQDGAKQEVIFFTMPTKAGQMVQGTMSAGDTLVEDEELPF